MPWEARLQFLLAVFFTFSGVGFLLDLANPNPGRTAHIVFLVFMGGVIGSSACGPSYRTYPSSGIVRSGLGPGH